MIFDKIQTEGKYKGVPSIFVDFHSVQKNYIEYIKDQLSSKKNPSGTFRHEHSGENIHLVFTSSNILSVTNQHNIINIVDELYNQKNLPKYITIQTDGIQPLTNDFVNYFNGKVTEWSDNVEKRIELFWSIKAEYNIDINVKNIKQYKALSSVGQFLFDCDNCNWDNIEQTIENIKSVNWDVFIIPKTNKTYIEAIQRGYKISYNGDIL